MAWAVKYRTEFDDERELEWKVDISEDAWAGAVTDLVAGGNPLIFNHNNINDDWNDPIRSSTATIQVYSEDNFILTDLYAV